MNDYFKDQVAVVTGAGGTLCRAIAIDLSRKGAKVVLVGRTREKLQAVADIISEFNGKFIISPCDVTDENAVKSLSNEIYNKCGPCRFLINGAGGNNIKALTTNLTFENQELEDGKREDMVGFFDLDMNIFKEVLEINTLGTVIPSRVFGRQMAGNGGGAILNFASMNSYRPLTKVPAYAMSKAAMVNFTQWLAVYFATAGIRVNAIAPGFFVNERNNKYLCTPEGGLSQRGINVMQHTPMSRFGKAEELLGCVEWLLDDRVSGFVTGITVPVDGGFLSSAGV